MAASKGVNIGYWIVTGLIALMMIGSSIPGIMETKDSLDFMNGKLGYPIYFIPFNGITKLLGAIAIIIPGFPRIKEWAYAGMAFDLIGAIYSIAATNPFVQALPIFLPLVLLGVSYILYHKRLSAVALN